MSQRSRRINAVAATAFVLGGSLFAIGAALAQGDVGGPRLAAVVYLVGGVFFSTGGYAAVLQVVNAPREAPRRRWWSRRGAGGRRAGRLDWLSAVVLFVGTLVFAINLRRLAARRPDAGPGRPPGLVARHDRLRALPRLRPPGDGRDLRHLATLLAPRRDLGWWIVVVNQLGSVLFMVSAVASFVRADGDVIAVGIANWGTLTGALCFAVAGVMQEFERPDRPPMGRS